MKNNTNATRVQLGTFMGHYVVHPLLQVIRWFIITSLKIGAYVLLALLTSFLVMSAWITVNTFRTDYSVETVNGEFRHSEDQMTTDIVNWLTGEVTVPESIRLPLYRQYIMTVRENSDMEIPENSHSLDYPKLRLLALEWYAQKYPDANGSEEEKTEVINNLFEEAVRPPLEGFGPNVNERVWRVVGDSGAPRVRLLGEQDEYASRIMAASASRGDKQAFYYPPENTIYIRYNDSVRVLLNEAPHAVQFNEQPYTSHWRLITSLAKSFLAGVVHNADVDYNSEYQDPETLEGEAHRVIRERLLLKHGLSTVFEEAPNQLAPQHVCVVPNPLQREVN